MSFVVSYNKDGNCYRVEKRVTERSHPSPSILSEDGSALILGETFDRTSEEIMASGWEDNPTVLNLGCSAICVVRWTETKCWFATDICGREILYYYHDSGRFIVADTFWDIVKELKPSYGSIDKEVAEELIANGGGSPCDYRTIIKGLFWTPPNTLGIFDATSGQLFITCYASICRSGEVTNLDEAVEGMDAAMNNMASFLVRRFPESVFGLGLSGGLDSRTALHYLQKHGAQLTCFNTCTVRPHGVLLASSLKKARALAAVSKVEYREVEWEPDDIRHKMDLLLRNQPLGTSGHYTNAYKYEERGMPTFDVLVSAGNAIGPCLVGALAPAGSDSWKHKQVFAYLMGLALGGTLPYGYTCVLVRRYAEKLGFGIDDTVGTEGKLWSSIVSSEVVERVGCKVSRFADERLNKGWKPADIFLDFGTSVQGPVGRNGAYESRFGQCRSFTIYTPFLVKEGLRWDTSIVADRTILKELIMRKMPEFAAIGEETYGGARASTRFADCLDKLGFLLRGSGIMSDEWYAKNAFIRAAFFEDMNNGCEWFFETFPCCRDADAVCRLSPTRRNAIWEVKRLVDCLETKRYVDF